MCTHPVLESGQASSDATMRYPPPPPTDHHRSLCNYESCWMPSADASTPAEIARDRLAIASVRSSVDVRVERVACLASSVDVRVERVARLASSVDVRVERVARLASSVDVRVERVARLASSVDVRVETVARLASSVDVRVETVARLASSVDVRVETVARLDSLVWVVGEIRSHFRLISGRTRLAHRCNALEASPPSATDRLLRRRSDYLLVRCARACVNARAY